MATVPSIDMLPLIFRTTVPKTPEFVTMIDNMDRAEPIERNKFWALLSTVAERDWIGSASILQQAVSTRTPDVIEIDGERVEIKCWSKWGLPLHVTYEPVWDLFNHDA